MEFLDKLKIGCEVIFERKYIFDNGMKYSNTTPRKGKLISRVKRFVDDNSLPQFVDIIGTDSGFLFVEPNDYKFVS